MYVNCDASFSINQGLKNIFPDAVHEKKKPFKCVCDNTFAGKQTLNCHILVVHERNEPFKCNICDARFTLNSLLKKHFSSVHEKKPH